MTVGAGLAIAGATNYAFLAITARALGPARYSSFSGFWSSLFLVGPALFVPFEQEVGRAVAARTAAGVGFRSIVLRATGLIAVVAAVAILALVAMQDVLLRELLDGHVMLLVSFALGIACYAGSHIVKGVTSGSGQFSTYGLVLGAEGIVRLGLCASLFVLGGRHAGPFGIAVAVAPLVALPFFPRKVIKPEPDPVEWRTLGRAVLHLFLGAVFAALLVNAGPVAMKALSEVQEDETVSRFLASLVIARVPLFLFQAVQVALLPKLSALAAAGRHEELAVRMRRLLIAVLVLGGAAAGLAATLGPPIIKLVFGSGFALGNRDLGLLALSSTAYMCALAFNQGLIAYQRQDVAAAAWIGGCVALFATLALPFGTVLVVELAMLIGALTAAALMGRVFVGGMRREMRPAHVLA